MADDWEELRRRGIALLKEAPNRLSNLASSDGTPLSDIGRIPYRPPPAAEARAALDREALGRLADPQLLPHLNPPFNATAWEAMLASTPASANIEDRRYMTVPGNPFTNAAFVQQPGRGLVTKAGYDQIELDAIRKAMRRR